MTLEAKSYLELNLDSNLIGENMNSFKQVLDSENQMLDIIDDSTQKLSRDVESDSSQSLDSNLEYNILKTNLSNQNETPKSSVIKSPTPSSSQLRTNDILSKSIGKKLKEKSTNTTEQNNNHSQIKKLVKKKLKKNFSNHNKTPKSSVTKSPTQSSIQPKNNENIYGNIQKKVTNTTIKKAIKVPKTKKNSSISNKKIENLNPKPNKIDSTEKNKLVKSSIKSLDEHVSSLINENQSHETVETNMNELTGVLSTVKSVVDNFKLLEKKYSSTISECSWQECICKLIKKESNIKTNNISNVNSEIYRDIFDQCHWNHCVCKLIGKTPDNMNKSTIF